MGATKIGTPATWPSSSSFPRRGSGVRLLVGHRSMLGGGSAVDGVRRGVGRCALASPCMTTVELPDPVVVSGPSLSPSRASDFQSCPLKYRFRVIDRLPEPPSGAATRGTVVHAVLERLFDLPAAERTLERAAALLGPEWDRLLEAEPELAELRGGRRARRDGLPRFLDDSVTLLERYFSLEDPTRLEPAERELHVSPTLESGLTLRGYVDRLDVTPRVTCGSSTTRPGARPRPGFEARAMFQMRFYALVLWRLHGRVPRMLQLLYLGNGEVLRYEPDEADLLRHRAQGRGAVAGDPAGHRGGRLAAEHVQAVRLVLLQGHPVPCLGRHPPHCPAPLRPSRSARIRRRHPREVSATTSADVVNAS